MRRLFVFKTCEYYSVREEKFAYECKITERVGYKMERKKKPLKPHLRLRGGGMDNRQK